MAEKITIEIEAKFSQNGLDQLVSGAERADKAINNLKKSTDSIGKSSGASKAFDNVEKSVSKAEKAVSKTKTAVDKLTKSKADIKVGVQDKATTILNKIKNQMKGIAGGKAYNIAVAVKDKATTILSKLKSSLQTIGGKAHNIGVYLKDHASSALRTIGNSLKSIAGKTWTVAINVKDGITGFIRGITNKIFSLKTLIAGVMGGMAMNQFVLKPIAFSDQMRNSQISFETMLGSAQEGSKMMEQIKQFARTTPLDTTGVIDSVRQMLNSGAWTKDTVMTDIEKIGNAAMASGGGVDAMKGITLALSQMSMTGRVNAQDMMQLANRGIPAWQMLADYFKVSVKEVREMAQEGEITAEQGIEAIMQGMDRYDGMMAKLSKETASGIWSNIKDTFQLSIVESWGNGLQRGAIKGLTSMADWLDKISPKLDQAGASLEKIGEYLSTKFFDAVGGIQDAITEILDSDAFINADGIGGKLKVLAGGLWDKFKGWLKEKAPDFGEFLGSALSKGIIGISDFITGALGGDTSGVNSVAAEIGSSFWDAFCNAFDGAKVTAALKRAIGSIFSSAGKLLPGGQKADLGSWISAGLIAKFLGMTGIGSLLGKGAKWIGGKGLSGLGNMSVAKGAGLFKTGLLLQSAYGLYDIGQDVKSSYTNWRDGDKIEATAKALEAGNKTTYMASGAGIGYAIGAATPIPIIDDVGGTLLGTGIGYSIGSYKGKKAANEYRQAAGAVESTDALNEFAKAYGIDAGAVRYAETYSSKRMKEAIKNSKLTAQELGEIFEASVTEDMASRFGKVSLSLSEIDSLAKKMTFRGAAKDIEAFDDALISAEQTMSTFADSARAVEKHSLRSSLGLDLTDASEVERFVADVQNHVFYAKEALSDKQYEFATSAALLLDVESPDGKYILEQGNAFYASIQDELGSLELELNEKIKLYSADGILTFDEQSELLNLSQKITDIVQRLNDAEVNAELDLIKLKFGDGNLTSQNFQEFMGSMSDYTQFQAEKYDEAYKSQLKTLNLQYPDVNSEGYKKGFEVIRRGYTDKVKELSDTLFNSTMEITAPAYSNAFGGSEQFVASMRQGLEKALNTNTDPINWTLDNMRLNLGNQNISAAVYPQLQEILSFLYKNNPVEVPIEAKFTTPKFDLITPGLTAEQRAYIQVTPEFRLTEADIQSAEQLSGLDLPDLVTTANVLVDPNYTLTSEQLGGLGASSQAEGASVIQSLFPTLTGSTTANVSVTPNYQLSNSQILGMGKGPLNQSTAQSMLTFPTFTGNTTANVGVNALYSLDNPLTATDIGTQSASINADVPTTADYQLQNNLTAADIGEQSCSITATVTVNANYVKGTSTGGSPKSLWTNPFSIGNNANGGIVNGKQLSWLAENGYPEAVIPFEPSKRSRALSLFEETGRRLGVLNNADGGIVGDANPYQSAQSEVSVGGGSGGSLSVKMDKGSVQININSDGSNTLTETIEEQKEEIAEQISGIIAKALGSRFANMPVKVTL